MPRIKSGSALPSNLTGAGAGEDTLSDYIPQSNEISRVPSVAPQPAGGEDDEDEEEDEIESDGDFKMGQEPSEDNTKGVKSKGKSPSAKKVAKMKFDDSVRSPFNASLG